MPYKFLKRYPRDNDFLDVEQIKGTLNDLVSKVTSDIGEHDVNEEEQSFADGTFYQCVLDATTVPVGYGGSVPHAQPPEEYADFPANTVELDNTGGWTVIDEIPEFTTNNHELIQFWFQCNYLWAGFDNAGNHNYADTQTWSSAATTDQPWRVPSIRFGVRINGRVVAFTGTKNPNHRPYIPVKASKEIQEFDGSVTVTGGNNADWPGPILIKSNRCSGPSKTMMAVRLSDVHNAPPGRIKIELVARRLKRIGKTAFAQNDVVGALTRQMFIVRYPASVSRQRDPNGIAMTNLQVGDSVSQVNLLTNNLEQLETELNGLDSENVNKLNRFHYPIPLVVSNGGVIQHGFNGVSYSPAVTVNNWCPGETTSTFATLGTLVGSTGWTPLYGSSTEFLVAPSSGSVVTSTKNGYLLVTGRVVLQSIKRNGSSLNTYAQTHNQQAAVAIYQKTGSVRTLRPESVVTVARTATPAPGDVSLLTSSLTIEDRVDVPLMAVIDLSATLTSNDIDSFGICVSALNYLGSARVDIEVVEANLSFEYYLP